MFVSAPALIDVGQHASGGPFSAAKAIAAMLVGLYVLVHLLFRFLGWRWRRRLKREGVSTFGTMKSFGWDMHQRLPDGRIPCRVHVLWKSGTNGAEYLLDTPWFWTDPTKPLVHAERIPLRVVPDSAKTHYEIDMSAFGIGVPGSGNEIWTRGSGMSTCRNR
jgi:hypothetical protein